MGGFGIVAGGIVMIEKCYEAPMNTFPDFMDAVDYKKNNGWKSQKRDGEWEDVCPECQDNGGCR